MMKKTRLYCLTLLITFILLPYTHAQGNSFYREDSFMAWFEKKILVIMPRYNLAACTRWTPERLRQADEAFKKAFAAINRDRLAVSGIKRLRMSCVSEKEYGLPVYETYQAERVAGLKKLFRKESADIIIFLMIFCDDQSKEGFRYKIYSYVSEPNVTVTISSGKLPTDLSVLQMMPFWVGKLNRVLIETAGVL